jgi:hypothetical protein
MDQDRQQLIRTLLEEYIEMYASRDDRLTTHFSENFRGYAGGGHVLVKDRQEGATITRQDFRHSAHRLNSSLAAGSRKVSIVAR